MAILKGRDLRGVMELRGEFRIGEATAYGSRALARLTGQPGPMIAAVVVSAASVVLGSILYEGLIAVDVAPRSGSFAATVVSGVVGFLIAMRLCRWLITRKFQKALGVRGLALHIPADIRIGEDGIAYDSAGLTYIIPWAAVSDVMVLGPYWVFLAGSQPFYVPKRFFADPAEEAAFKALMASRVSDATLKRSPALTQGA